jgi:hypothetical protein
MFRFKRFEVFYNNLLKIMVILLMNSILLNTLQRSKKNYTVFISHVEDKLFLEYFRPGHVK